MANCILLTYEYISGRYTPIGLIIKKDEVLKIGFAKKPT
jgi:hypothetical protein